MKASFLENRSKSVLNIVYPNVSQFAQWEELKYSIRSVAKNLKHTKFKITVVGDFPNYLNPDRVNHIPCEYTGETPRIDILHKHFAVINDSSIPEEYIWMNDDIYFINPVHYPDLCLLVATNNLKNSFRKYNTQTLWGKDLINTYNCLLENKLPTWNYSVHIPHRFEKRKVKFLVNEFKMMENPLLLTSMYYNYFYPGFRPYIASLEPNNNICFTINRPNPDSDLVNKLLQTMKFMNNGEAGMGDFIQNILHLHYSQKTEFEL
jgi:hypothetical protein